MTATPDKKPGTTARICFQRATAADAYNIERLTRAAYAKWVPVIGREPLPMTFQYAEILARDPVELAMDNAAIVGLVHLTHRDGYMLIENLATDPSRQSGGIGNALLALAEAEAGKAGFREMRLYTNGAFAGNLRFYAKRGYAVTAREPFMGGTTVHMAKALA